MPLVAPPVWDSFLESYPDHHLLQTSAWGKLKSSFGWKSLHLVSDAVQGAGAQILLRPLPGGWKIAYLGKGPLAPAGLALDDPALTPFWQELHASCRRARSIYLKVEPDLWDGAGAQLPTGFRLSAQTIQPPRSILVDLQDGEDAVLARMKQKTRYNLRLAQKKGVLVQPSTNLEAFYQLMLSTGRRDAFGVHSLEYYRQAYQLFHASGRCELFLAMYEGEPLGGIMVFRQGNRLWYLYGASGDEHRELMPAYLLQWEAMRWGMRHGCTEYDLWGVPDAELDDLEANFMQRSDGLWGVYRFKRGFGGQLVRAQGPWDYVYQPLLYRLILWYSQRKSGMVGA